jgi:hypothetical protein
VTNPILTIELALPEAEILKQANGSVPAALRVAASYGYLLACRDLEHVTLDAPAVPAEVAP